MGHTPDLNPYEQGWHSAVQLLEAVRAGHPLPQQQTSLVMSHGEVYHCGVFANLAKYHGQEVDYSSGYLVAGSTWKGIAATGLASMAYNSRKRSKARKQAASQWRNYGLVPLHLTNQRLFLGAADDVEVLHLEGGIIAFEPYFDQYSMLLQTHYAPMMLEGPAVPYIAVILHVMLRRQLPELPTYS